LLPVKGYGFGLFGSRFEFEEFVAKFEASSFDFVHESFCKTHAPEIWPYPEALYFGDALSNFAQADAASEVATYSSYQENTPRRFKSRFVKGVAVRVDPVATIKLIFSTGHHGLGRR
jgi:hypothetical protein